MTPKEKREMAQKIANRLVENPKLLAELKDRILNDSIIPLDSCRTQLSAWQARYLGIGIKKDFSKLHIPERPEGFSRLIVVVKELKISGLITELKKKMNFWLYSDLKELDKVKDIVQRPDGDYAIWVRDCQEADEELKNLSADDIQREGTNTETLKERFLHEWAYHDETGKHLDVENWTICASSRDPDGNVPGVYWHPGYGKVRVYWNCSNYRNSYGRARQAVS